MNARLITIAKCGFWWMFWIWTGLITLVAGVGLWMQYQHLVFNDSTCEPVGLYQLRGSPYPLHHGELVEVEIPGPAHHAAVAEGLKYHWFPPGQPWIKEIAAVPGQTVTLARSGVRVEGHTLPNSRVDRWTPGHHHRIVHY
ncbi:S26 family signal peptidase, partial [Acidithiobacillus sp.]